MKVRRYIELIKGVNDTTENLIQLLKENGATEGEAVLALMVTRDMSMDEVQNQIAKTNLFAEPGQHKSSKVSHHAPKKGGTAIG